MSTCNIEIINKVLCFLFICAKPSKFGVYFTRTTCSVGVNRVKGSVAPRGDRLPVGDTPSVTIEICKNVLNAPHDCLQIAYVCGISHPTETVYCVCQLLLVFLMDSALSGCRFIIVCNITFSL